MLRSTLFLNVPSLISVICASLASVSLKITVVKAVSSLNAYVEWKLEKMIISFNENNDFPILVGISEMVAVPVPLLKDLNVPFEVN